MVFAELIRKQSEEARIFADLQENNKKRFNMQRAIDYFLMQTNL